MRWTALEDEACSLARTVAVVGDRWTLLILRDCFLRVRRFEDFQARLGVTRPILASRLRKLVDEGVLRREPYGERPVRLEYRLTPKGLDLYPVLMALVHWGDVHKAGRRGRPLLHRHLRCDRVFDPVTVCSVCRKPLQPRQVGVQAGPGAETAHNLPAAAATPRPRRRARRASGAASQRQDAS